MSKPGEEFSQAFNEGFHATTNSTIRTLSSITDSPKTFRETYGKLIEWVFVETDTSVKSCLTDEQAARLTAAVTQAFPEDGDMEKPLLAVSDELPSVFRKFNEEYNVDIYSMSMAEAYKFAMEIAQDPTKLDPKIVQSAG